jgi:hypothetical protein
MTFAHTQLNENTLKGNDSHKSIIAAPLHMQGTYILFITRMTCLPFRKCLAGTPEVPPPGSMRAIRGPVDSTVSNGFDGLRS